ncbi:hypothetical protein TBLA_0B03250 [Henningerozyma blattae CBS 6284]|uniref:phosphopentomutase n=1 Tax=Henningerozyma blattae (strain ATCC 34711 / CBS 6284 / DSM 70876 / NBRC 10599 / NRRL Y-10934 / UCD 77-7) TaxID=1071380 RepID=I2GYG4_HENB6|nr:hypothetical protein TBLA_0B03250 [Tetrapisispora blattae CBS 6284]CCH59166.1 hypothetical protein TBLA_0B03250 [Tetrapisispora blattae CBS 6284]
MSDEQQFNALIKDYPEDLQKKVLLWLEQDKDDSTRKEIIDLCKSANVKELHERFDSRITFGTAGLRSTMEAGFSRMNTLTVLQASQGLATYMKNDAKNTGQKLIAVIGHDHRYHSKEFAKIAATVFLIAGFKVYYLNDDSLEDPRDNKFVHTPMVPFTVKNLKASVGVMVTASHNPKMDNGYKVYYSNGCQIIPPHDSGISQCIDANLEPWENSWNYKEIMANAESKGDLIYHRDVMLNDYITQLEEKLTSKDIIHLSKKIDVKSKPWFVYTPMHGVGYEIFTKISNEILHMKEGEDFIVVEEQKHPDPGFPTVSFPNPEEKGAIDMGIKLAEDNGISLVIANDPDADRFSIAVKSKGSQGTWHQFTGNEIGYLFAYFEFQKYKISKQDLHRLYMVNSTVSSQMIKKMAEIEGFNYEETLTGFKWIGNRAIDLINKGNIVPFGYEEAIGYMFPTMEIDKDGIAATVIFIQAFMYWNQIDKMDPYEIIQLGFKKYGVFIEYNGYYRYTDLGITKKIFDYVRYDYDKGVSEGNKKYPDHIGEEFKIIKYRDLTTGYQSDTPDNKPLLPVDPSSQMITVEMIPTDNESDGSIRLTIRGSGTEPKLKVYIEACSRSATEASFLAKQAWNVLKREWMRPEQTGITTAF